MNTYNLKVLSSLTLFVLGVGWTVAAIGTLL